MKGTKFLLLLILVSCASPTKKKDPILGPLEARRNSFRQCYLESEQYKGRFSKPQGKVVIQMTISKEGKVVDEKIIDSTFKKDPNFSACILDQARKVDFEEREADVTIDHLVNFLPVEE
jgi:hypothetical protein